LRRPSRPLQPDEIRSREIQRLIEEMKETMYAAPGVGLAAPQIGQPIQLAVIEDRQQYMKDWSAEELAARDRKPVPFHAIINPAITFLSREQIEFFEGCLSVTGLLALVPRAHTVRVEYLDEKGTQKRIEARGWYARILQHEIDHLLGNLYLDRMYAKTLMTVENYKKFWVNKSTEQIKQDLEVDLRG
jgi:peptide deformylase